MTRQGAFEQRQGPPREVLGAGTAPPPGPQHRPLGGPGLTASSPTHGRCVLPASCRPGPVPLHPIPEAEKPSLRGGKGPQMHLLRLSGQRGLALQPNSPSSLPSSPFPLAKGVRKDALPLLQLASATAPLGRGGEVRAGRRGWAAQQGRAGCPVSPMTDAFLARSVTCPQNPHTSTRPERAGWPHPALVFVHRTRVMDSAT